MNPLRLNGTQAKTQNRDDTSVLKNPQSNLNTSAESEGDLPGPDLDASDASVTPAVSPEAPGVGYRGTAILRPACQSQLLPARKSFPLQKQKNPPGERIAIP